MRAESGTFIAGPCLSKCKNQASDGTAGFVRGVFVLG